MLSEAVKQSIQHAYSQFLQSKGLTARYGQKLMIAEIARTLGGIELDDRGQRTSDEHICVIEAGTGTGKTVAYLLPALLIARALDKKLVVATATVALQEQVVYKDLPELQRHTDLEFRASLAKGRSRYVCLSKLDSLLTEVHSGAQSATRPLYEDELPGVDEQAVKIYDSMMDALAANQWDGERDSWPDGVDDTLWRRVTTDHRQCAGRRCSHVASCSFFRARDDLHTADCIVANHDLVLADLALGGGAILPAPEDAIYVFDEGHQLPQKALGHFAHHSRLLSSVRWLEQCQKSLGAMLGEIDGAGRVDRFGEQLPAVLEDCRRHLEQLHPLLDELAQQVSEVDRQSHYRFAGGVVPEALRVPSAELYRGFDRLTDLLGKMLEEVEDALEQTHCPVPRVDLEQHYPVLGAWQARAEANRDLWRSYAEPDERDHVPRARWLTPVEAGTGVDIEVCSSPILAAGTLAGRLWQRCAGAVVTSATLAALGRFDRFRMRAGTPEDSRYGQMPSPFDFTRATLSVPVSAVEAGDAVRHTDSVVSALPEILAPEEGALVLFSSRRQMLDVYERLPEAWRERILVQGEKSKQAMLEAHRERIDAGQGSVLFGLASFAEGVDLPGDYCRHVVIAKLPFAVPDDPIEAALSEWVEARGGNAFMEITVPDASLRLTQACGRLLRGEKDQGRITLLDRRIVTKRYGKAILEALPPFKREIAR